MGFCGPRAAPPPAPAPDPPRSAHPDHCRLRPFLTPPAPTPTPSVGRDRGRGGRPGPGHAGPRRWRRRRPRRARHCRHRRGRHWQRQHLYRRHRHRCRRRRVRGQARQPQRLQPVRLGRCRGSARHRRRPGARRRGRLPGRRGCGLHVRAQARVCGSCGRWGGLAGPSIGGFVLEREWALEARRRRAPGSGAALLAHTQARPRPKLPLHLPGSTPP